MTYTFWHNPRCSKSRQTLELLQENGVDPDVRHYLADAPNDADLRHVRDLLGMPIASFIRTGERMFKELGLSKDSDEDVLFAAMAAHPILIERPILMSQDRAAIGRPPENVLDILEK